MRLRPAHARFLVIAAGLVAAIAIAIALLVLVIALVG
jgi:hypothetical protein